jgi:hypothetical protein
LTQKSKDFACNLKNRLYNVDIRERERNPRGKNDEKEYQGYRGW